MLFVREPDKMTLGKWFKTNVKINSCRYLKTPKDRDKSGKNKPTLRVFITKEFPESA